MRVAITGFLTIFLLMAGQAFTADQMGPTAQRDREGSQAMFIHVDRAGLTVKLREAPIKTVLEEIGRRTGIEIVILGSLTQNISTEFEDLPLEEGMRRLLKGYGWSLVTAGEDSNDLEKVFVLPGIGSVGLGRRQASLLPQRDQEAKQSPTEQLPADEPAHPVAVVVNKKEVQHYFDVLFDDPGSLAEMEAFREAANALSAEEIEPLIQMLEDENFEPSEWEAALSDLSVERRGRIVRNLPNLDIRAEVIGRLKQIRQLKTVQERSEQ